MDTSTEKNAGKKYLDGQVLLIDKPLDWTSFDVVKKIRTVLKRKYRFKKLKVGHAGTLDPLASGLMIVCTGKATKQIINYQDLGKEYRAEICLGATTPSYDRETEIDAKFPFEHITKELLQKTINEYFLGEIDQIPPIFSAKKIHGDRAHELARAGKPVELKPSRITIYEILIEEFNLPNFTLLIKCSKGTYIRSLAHDIGKSLNSGAYLFGLRRTKIGEIDVNEAVPIDKLSNDLTNA